MRNPEDQRHLLSQAVLHVRSQRATSRRELADVMRLSPTTAGQYADQLIASRHLNENGVEKGPMGRPKRSLTTNADAGWFAGIEFNAERIQGVRVDFSGVKAASLTTSLPESVTPKAVIVEISKMIAALAKGATGTLLGIGVGVPGIVDPVSGIARDYTFIEGWKEVPLAQTLHDKHAVPVTLGNCVSQLRRAHVETVGGLLQPHHVNKVCEGVAQGGRISEPIANGKGVPKGLERGCRDLRGHESIDVDISLVVLQGEPLPPLLARGSRPVGALGSDTECDHGKAASLRLGEEGVEVVLVRLLTPMGVDARPPEGRVREKDHGLRHQANVRAAREPRLERDETRVPPHHLEHHHAVGVFEHDIHVMLGEKDADRPVARNARGERHQVDAFFRRHAGGRLVEQQELGVVGERDRELEALEIAVGEFAAGPPGLRFQPQEIEEALGEEEGVALAQIDGATAEVPSRKVNDGLSCSAKGDVVSGGSPFIGKAMGAFRSTASNAAMTSAQFANRSSFFRAIIFWQMAASCGGMPALRISGDGAS